MHVLCTSLETAAVAFADVTPPLVARATRPRSPMDVVTRNDRGRHASTTTTAAAAVAAAVTTVAVRRVTSWLSVRAAAVCKMHPSATVVVTASAGNVFSTTATTLTCTGVLLLLLLQLSTSVTAIGQLQGQYNPPYPDICPR